MTNLATQRYPGPISTQMIDELQRYVVMDPQPFAIDLSQCHGSYLGTVDGQSVLDFGGYYGSKLIAHNHPELSDPDYQRRLFLAANNKVPNPDFLTRECLDYYRLLLRLAPACMKRSKTLEAYVVNSGAEAIENVMKYLINLHHQRHPTNSATVGKRRFIYFDNAFHGRTIAALNVTQIAHDPLITEDFRGLVRGNLQVPFPSIDADASHQVNDAKSQKSLKIIEACLQKYPGEIVGILVEPIQGAGGHNVAQGRFFVELSELAHRYNTCLAFDEVQTAGGQLGDIFACDQWYLPHPPQAVAVGKKFANGVVYMLETMDDRGVLDSTWGGSLSDMVRFCQEWKIVEQEKLIDKVMNKADRMLRGLLGLQRQFPTLLHNIRGAGLYQGFSIRGDGKAGRLIDLALQEQNLFLLGAGLRSIRLRPSLSVTENEIDELMIRLTACLNRLISDSLE